MSSPSSPASELTLTIDPPAGMSGATVWMPSSGAVEVDPHHAFPVGELTSASRARNGMPGVVDEPVDAPVGPPRASRRARSSRPAFDDVEAAVHDAVAEPADLLVRDRSRRRSRPRRRAPRLGGALAAGGAGDDDDLALDSAHLERGLYSSRCGAGSRAPSFGAGRPSGVGQWQRRRHPPVAARTP